VRSNIVVVPRRKNTAQSQKLELNDVVDTDRLANQVLEFLNERVKKGVPHDSKGACTCPSFPFAGLTTVLVDLDFHDLDGNLLWTDQSAYLWGLRIRGTPVHFYSRLMPYSGVRKTTEGYKSRFEAIPKIPSTIVEEVDFSEAGIVSLFPLHAALIMVTLIIARVHLYPMHLAQQRVHTHRLRHELLAVPAAGYQGVQELRACAYDGGALTVLLRDF
jgi:hypothetical protein